MLSAIASVPAWIGIGGGAMDVEEDPADEYAIGAAFALGGLPRSISWKLDCDNDRLNALGLGIEEGGASG